MIWIGSLEHIRLGPIWVAASPLGVRGLYMRAAEQTVRANWPGRQVLVEPGRVAPFLRQLDQYLSGQRRDFELPIDWSVLTLFQEEVLRRVCAIPYGQTRTYQQLADDLGKPGAARAVGQANATNPMPLIIPCHRVLGSDGGLHGYGGAGGVETKAWLLSLEGARLL